MEYKISNYVTGFRKLHGTQYSRYNLRKMGTSY